jgi:outer membrane protein W
MERTLRFIVVCSVALGMAAPSVCLARDPNYLVLKGGIYSPSDEFEVRDINGGVIDRIDPDTGFNGEIAIGHYFLPVFAVELGVGYFESDGVPPVEPGETKFRVVPILLTAKGLFPIGPVEPYGEFGIGGYIADLDVSGTVGNFSGSTKGTFGLHAGAGINFDITDAVFLGVEGRYLWAKPSFGGQDINLDGFTVTGNLGFRF